MPRFVRGDLSRTGRNVAQFRSMKLNDFKFEFMLN